MEREHRESFDDVEEDPFKSPFIQPTSNVIPDRAGRDTESAVVEKATIKPMNSDQYEHANYSLPTKLSLADYNSQRFDADNNSVESDHAESLSQSRIGTNTTSMEVAETQSGSVFPKHPQAPQYNSFPLDYSKDPRVDRDIIDRFPQNHSIKPNSTSNTDPFAGLWQDITVATSREKTSPMSSYSSALREQKNMQSEQRISINSKDSGVISESTRESDFMIPYSSPPSTYIEDTVAPQLDPFAINSPAPPNNETQLRPQNEGTGLDEGLDSLLDFLGSGTEKRRTSHNDSKGVEKMGVYNVASQPAIVASSISSKFEFFDLPGGSSDKAPLFSDDDFHENSRKEPIDIDPLSAMAHQTSFDETQTSMTQSNFQSASTSGAATKPKNRGSIDLEEARRRTSLLTGGSSYSRKSSNDRVTPSSSTGESNSSKKDSFLSSSRQIPSTDPYIVPIGASDSGGSYFNEDLLRQRQNRSTGYVPAQYTDQYEGDSATGWDTGAILGKAGNMVSAAKSGAKSLLQKANGYAMNNTSEGFGPMQGSASYDVIFGEGRLGFTLLKASDGSGVVCRIQPGSTAANMGVAGGDILTAVNKRRMSSYDEIMSILPTIARPVLVTFSKPSGSSDMNTGQISSGSYGRYDGASADVINSNRWTNNQANFCLLGDVNSDWRIGTQDLQFKRPDFHGVVVRAFGGVFSWSLYGTSDGTETPGSRISTGDTYTEYVMRCQWGPDPQHMSPWMVARRYREFDALDKDLKEVFPHLKESFPSLPPKEFFKSSAEVVARRRVGLEQYMTFLIGNCPDVLCCSQMDRFLGIADRIGAIKGGGHSRGLSKGDDNDVDSMSSSIDNNQISINFGGTSLVGTDYLLNLMTAEEAYEVMRVKSASLRPLGKHSLSTVETAVRNLENRIKEWGHEGSMTDPLLDHELHKLAELCQQSWPALKATALRADDIPEGMEILPRIIQCDEDMERALSSLTQLCRNSFVRNSEFSGLQTGHVQGII